MQELKQRQEYLDELIQFTNKAIENNVVLSSHWLKPAHFSSINFIVIGRRGAHDAIWAGKVLMARGFFVNPVSYLAVPLNHSGIRF